MRAARSLSVSQSAPSLSRSAPTSSRREQESDSSDSEGETTTTAGRTVVIDAGSGYTKAGFAADDARVCVFQTVVGRSQQDVAGVDPEALVGDEAMEHVDALALSYPIDRGAVVDWDDMEAVWRHTFYSELRVTPSEHPVLLTEVPLAPKASRERTTRIMFEVFHVKALFICSQPMLSLFACDAYTGVVLDVGDSVAHATPVYDGFPLPPGWEQGASTSLQLVTLAMKCVKERGHSSRTRREMISRPKL